MDGPQIDPLLHSKRTDIPIYSFEQHQRQENSLSVYSPHVLLLEGILALHDPRILDMLDMRIFVEADGDVCLSRRSLSSCSSSVSDLTDIRVSKSSVMSENAVEI